MSKTESKTFAPNLPLDKALAELDALEKKSPHVLNKLPYRIVLSDYVHIIAEDNRTQILGAKGFCSAYLDRHCQYGFAELFSEKKINDERKNLEQQHARVIDEENGDLQKLDAINEQLDALKLQENFVKIAPALCEKDKDLCEKDEFNVLRHFLSHVEHDFSEVCLGEPQVLAFEYLYEEILKANSFSENTLIPAIQEEKKTQQSKKNTKTNNQGEEEKKVKTRGILLFEKKTKKNTIQHNEEKSSTEEKLEYVPTLAGTLFMFSFLLAKGQMNRLLDQTPFFKNTQQKSGDAQSHFNERRKIFTYYSPHDSLIMADDFKALNAYVHLVNLRKSVPHELVTRHALPSEFQESLIDKESNDIILAGNNNPKTSYLLEYLERNSNLGEKKTLQFCRRFSKPHKYKEKNCHSQSQSSKRRKQNKFSPIPSSDKYLPYWIINDNVACRCKGQPFRLSRNQFILMAVAKAIKEAEEKEKQSSWEFEIDTCINSLLPEQKKLSCDDKKAKITHRIEHIRNIFTFDKDLEPAIKKQRLKDYILSMCERHIYMVWDKRKDGAAPNIELLKLTQEIHEAVEALHEGDTTKLQSLVAEIIQSFEARKKDIDTKYEEDLAKQKQKHAEKQIDDNTLKQQEDHLQKQKSRLHDKIDRIIIPYFEGIKESNSNFDEIYKHCQFEANKSEYYKRITRALEFGKDEQKALNKGKKTEGDEHKERIKNRIAEVSKDWDEIYQALVTIDLYGESTEERDKETVRIARIILKKYIKKSKLLTNSEIHSRLKIFSVLDLFSAISKAMQKNLKQYDKNISSPEFVQYLQSQSVKKEDDKRFTGMLDAIGLSKFVPDCYISDKGKRRKTARESCKGYKAWNTFALAKEVLFKKLLEDCTYSQTVRILETIYEEASTKIQNSSTRYDAVIQRLKEASKDSYDEAGNKLKTGDKQYTLRRKILFLALEDLVFQKLEEQAYDKIDKTDKTEHGEVQIAYPYEINDQGRLVIKDTPSVNNQNQAKPSLMACIVLDKKQLGAFDRAKFYARPQPKNVLGLLHINGKLTGNSVGTVSVDFEDFKKMQDEMNTLRKEILSRIWKLEEVMVSELSDEEKKNYNYQSFKELIKFFEKSQQKKGTRLQTYKKNLITLRNAVMHNQPLCSVKKEKEEKEEKDEYRWLSFIQSSDTKPCKDFEQYKKLALKTLEKCEEIIG